MRSLKKILFIVTFFSFFNLAVGNSSNAKNITSIGKESAKVTVKVFSSLSCPHCAQFHGEVFNKLKKDYIDNGIVKFEHHSFPLDLQALNAEKVLKCFKNNEKKFAFLEEIYGKQDSWSRGKDINSINSEISKIAKNYGLNSDKINFCLKDENLEENILNERIDANKKYSITSTPTIFINEKKYEGKHNYKDFKKAIEKIL